jgi:hypothetical protein
MYEANVNGEDNIDGKLSLATSVPAEDSAGTWPDSMRAILLGRVARSEVPARRYWLRFLDAPLTSEIRLAGALDFDELMAAVPRILRCDASRVDRQTIQEWWEFAMRRRWFEQVGPRWGLTERADKDLRTERERVNSPDPRRLAAGIARWVLPTGLAGAIGVISAKYLSIDLAIVATAVLIIIGLLLAAATSRATDPSMDRWFARRACDWLEGRPVLWAFGANRESANFTRLYDAHDGGASGSDHSQFTAESRSAQPI